MRKKIYDILPPTEVGRIEAIEEEPEEVEIEVKEELSFKKQKFKQPRKPLGKGVLFSILLIVIAGVIAGIYFLTDTKVELVVHPKINNIQEEKRVVVALSDDFQAVEGSERFVLMGKVLTDEQSYTDQVAATGSAEGGSQAKGKIRILNNSSGTVILVATTRFLGTNGKIYRVPQPVEVPAMKGTEPGSVEVEVVAEEPGEDYNISSSTFTLPGLKDHGSPLYDSMKAETVTAISGGAKGTGLAVSDNDIAGAEGKFKQQKAGEVKNSLMSSLSDDYVLLEKATRQEVTSFVVSAKKGDRVDRFDVSGKMKTTVIAVKKEDIKRMISSMSGVEEGDNFGYEIKDIDVKELGDKDGNKEMTLFVSADYYGCEGNEDLVGKVLEKSKAGAIAELAKDDRIEKVEIRINPSWKDSISNKKENVTVKVVGLGN